LLQPGDHVLYLPCAHASIVETIAALSGVKAEPLAIYNGEVDIAKLKAQLRSNTKLVAMDFVCGETGTIWSTREVKHAIGNVLLHVDASQAPLAESVERTRLGADVVVLDAAKVGGMRGSGVLVAPRTTPLVPLIYGGGQERGLRSGTEAPALAAAFAAALQEARQEREDFAARARQKRAGFITKIRDIPNLSINEGKKNVPHILNISLAGRDTDYLVALLDEAGYAVSTRSACETDSDEGSRAVLALTSDNARATSTLRISWHAGMSERELARFAAALSKTVRFLDTHPS
jgi:cysteine desulfurase